MQAVVRTCQYEVPGEGHVVDARHAARAHVPRCTRRSAKAGRKGHDQALRIGLRRVGRGGTLARTRASQSVEVEHQRYRLAAVVGRRNVQDIAADLGANLDGLVRVARLQRRRWTGHAFVVVVGDGIQAVARAAGSSQRGSKRADMCEEFAVFHSQAPMARVRRRLGCAEVATTCSRKRTAQ
jgi:hypothetical protein